jgi:enoyl-CoA hydratase/carnithine racemase
VTSNNYRAHKRAADPLSDEYSVIKYDKSANYAVITLNAPERRNALTMAMVSELAQAIQKAEHDPEVRSMVITGAGTAFCAGRDSGESLRSSQTERDRFMTALYGRLTDIKLALEKPSISAINGPCRGGWLWHCFYG